MAKKPKGPPAEAVIPRDVRPRGRRALRQWIRDHLGIEIARQPVCRGHTAPFDYFSRIFLERPPLALVLGPRGGGKSFLSALDTHLTSRWNPRHTTRILGGSLAQSSQVHYALRDLIRGGDDADVVSKLTKDGAYYANDAEVKILAASSTSVRGPHVPTLKLDEVDEIDEECREAAMGMCMNRHGVPGSVVMTSTWHRVDGPMARLMERGHAGDFPVYSFCAFEVLEHCPEERSGKYLEKCPECPLVQWCHKDRDLDPLGRPKAKRADGHYAIDSLIQKARATGSRTFEADYLCLGPRVDGLWFPGFDPGANVHPRAEYDPSLAVHVAVDSGVFTGAVFFQVAKLPTPTGVAEEIRVFADYLRENASAEANAQALLEVARTRCNGRIDVASTDPAGGSRNPVGPTVIAEYERSGLRPLRRWPHGSVADGLALLESFLAPADGRSRLVVHPRCEATARALRHYRRAKRGGQWQDYPEDPQHPHEDLVDALRGGLRVCFPEGRSPQPNYARVHARQVF